MFLKFRLKSWSALRACLLSVVSILCLTLVGGCSSDDDPVTPPPNVAEKSCGDCHVTQAAIREGSLHLVTQLDVAAELAADRVGQTPEEVLHGADAENCIACHGATAVLAAGGQTEVEAMLHFFSTVDGKFTGQAEALNVDQWPHVACEACHDTPENHPGTGPHLAIFDSSTAQYIPLDQVSRLCGQCHGSLRFGGTDHRTFDAWAATGHGDNQQDVADELAAERDGETPHEVVTGGDPENCVACHAPTAVLADGGMSEEQALEFFFSTAGGTFTAGTAPLNTDLWPDVDCASCHDPHHPDVPAYFNSSTRQYEPMAVADDLCGQCHGSLRFAGTDHLSYDVRSGTGGIGVADDQLMGSVSCVGCHMYADETEGSNSSMQHGHSFEVTVPEAGGSTVSCERCHPGADAAATIQGFQTAYANLAATTTANVEAAATALACVVDPALLEKLDRAQHNLEFALGDESGGFHNHDYLMALLADANEQALEILATR